jgi:hypothetical protein
VAKNVMLGEADDHGQGLGRVLGGDGGGGPKKEKTLNDKNTFDQFS